MITIPIAAILAVMPAPVFGRLKPTLLEIVNVIVLESDENGL